MFGFFFLILNKKFHYFNQASLSISSMDPTLQHELNNVLKTIRPDNGHCKNKKLPVQLLEERARLQMSNYMNIAMHRLKSDSEQNNQTSARIEEVFSLVARLKHKTDFGGNCSP